MATSLGQAILTLRADQKPLEGALHSAETTTRRATFNMAQASRAVSVAFTAAGTAITGAFGLSIRSAANFQNAMAEVNTLGVKNLGALSEAVKSVAMDFGLDLLDAVKATYQAISAGATEAQMPMLLAESAKAARAGMSDLTTAIGLGTSVSNAFGLSLNDVTKIFDQAFIAVRLGVTDFSQLGSTLGQLSPIFSAAKLGTDEMFASVAALTKSGMQTSIAVTGMRTVVASVIKPSTDATKAAAELGIEFTAEALAAKGLQGFLQDVATATGGNVETMSRLFPSVEALQSVLALTGAQAKDFDSIMQAMAGSTGATDEAFRKFADGNTNFAWEQLKSTVQVLGIEIGDVLLPIVKDLLDAVTPIIRKLIEWMKANPQLTQGLVIAAAAIGGLMFVLGPLLLMLPGIVIAVSGFIAALTGVGPVAGIVGAAIAVGLVAAFKVIMEWIGRARTWITANWDQIVRIFEASRRVLTSGLQLLGKIVEVVLKVIGAYFQGFSEGVTASWNRVVGGSKDKAQSFLDIVEGVLEKVNEVLPQIIDRVADLSRWISTHWSAIVRASKAFYEGVYTPLFALGKLLVWVLGLLDRFSISGFEALSGLNQLMGGGGSGIGHHAAGGIVRTPWQLVGERGPELARLPMGTRVYNARDTQGMLGGGQPPIVFNTSITVHDASGDPVKLARGLMVEMENQTRSRLASRGLRFGTT
jgi:TP901 family phage tail tape measure protein